MMTGTFDLGRVTGFSAYEVWKAQPGNENKTEQDFLKFISSGGDWINFDTTPIDLKTVRDYKTYGSVKNLMDSDNLQDDGFVEMIEIISIYSDSDDATFSFESVSTPNNVLTGPDSPIYDVIQTLSVFTNAKSYKFVRRAQFNDSSKEVFITHAWECWEENGAAHKLADLFSITIGDVTKKTDGTNDVEFTKEELELGNNWIDFDTTPIDFDSVRTYRTYGSTANLDTDLTRGSVPVDASSAEFSSGTFMFESHSCRNNLKKSTEYDTIQTMILFSGSANPDEFAKYIRYGIFDEDGQTFTVQADWTMSGQFIDNEHMVSKAFKLARTFNLKIAGVTKSVDGSQNVEFTKEELGLDGGSSEKDAWHFENIFSGYAQSTSVVIGKPLDEAFLSSPRLKGDVFLIQLAPAIVKSEYYSQSWLSASDSNEKFIPGGGEEADYSTLLLISTMNITNEKKQSGEYKSYNYYNYDLGLSYNAVIKSEKLIALKGPTYKNVSDGTFITVLVRVDNSGVAWFDAIRPIGMPTYITNIWRLTQ